MRSSASMRAWKLAACSASSRLRSSASDELSACVYMSALPDVLGGNIYHNLYRTRNFCNISLPLEPVRQHRRSLRQAAGLVRSVMVKPLFGRRKQCAIDVAAEFSRRPARPILRQQFRRQERIAQHHTAVVMDQKDPRDEGIDIGQWFAAADPVAQWRKHVHEFQIRVGRAIEWPALAQKPPSALVLGRDLQTDRTRSFLRDKHA